MRHLYVPTFVVAFLLFYGCIATDTSFTRVAPGIWRGVLELEKFNIPVKDKDTIILLYDKFKEGELPFNFEVVYTDQERFYLEIYNGTERIRLDSIRYGRDRSLARDTMNVYFPEYQSYLHCEIRGGVMAGEWISPAKNNLRIPFYAYHGRNYRFTDLAEKPLADLTGKWAAVFGVGTDKTEKAVGEFRQTGNRLEGTFRTETGDYRFLEGTVQGRKFYLSCFDGSHAFLFAGSIQGDTLQGEFRSGKTWRTLWQAWKDPSFDLPDAGAITTLKSGAGPVRFSLQTPDGRKVEYPSVKFDGKIKIFTLMGTWCPNCRDEQKFLTEYLQKHPEQAREIEVVSFAFERNKEMNAANAQLMEYKKKMGIPFDIVFAGKADKAEAAAFFPMLSGVTAFPTMLILDKKGEVRHIHTGFDGPATSKYAAFVADFEQKIEALR